MKINANYTTIKNNKTEADLLSLDKDIACLKAHGQGDLDVAITTDHKSFYLTKIDLLTKISEFFNHSLKQARQDRLKDYVNKTHAIFNRSYWRYDDWLIENFYTQGLAKWNYKVFDRSILSSRIKNIICKNLGKRHKNHKIPSNKRRMEETRLQVELALKLGIKPKQNKKGVNGSIIYLNIQRKPIGIFKKEITTFGGAFNNFIAHAINWLGIKRQSDFCHHDQSHAEIAASVGDSYFSIGLVPLTRRITLEGSTGSFMLWESNVKEAADINWNYAPTKDELYQFQLMAIYDFFIGNLDRHTENWLVHLDKGDKLKHIAMIDNGNAFPDEHPTESPKDYIGRRKMFLWKSHPWAQYPLDERILDRLCELTPYKIEGFVEELRKHLPNKGNEFLSQKRLSNLFLRASLLRNIGRSKKSDFIPTKLGDAFSLDRIRKLKIELIPFAKK